jgi:hypothetical protein
MTAYLHQLDDLLRARRWVTQAGRGPRTAAWLAAQVLLFGLTYGAAMGTFGGFLGERSLQVCYSAAKVPLLLLVTFAIGLPSFFVLMTLYGLRDDFGEAVRALLAAQAGMTLILAALAPFTLVWYASSEDYPSATLFNGLMFATATISAQGLLRHYYRPLVLRQPRHRRLLVAWLVIYVFVAIQMAWVLRPYIGDPKRSVQFFRDDAWGNAYVVVIEMIWKVLTHR